MQFVSQRRRDQVFFRVKRIATYATFWTERSEQSGGFFIILPPPHPGNMQVQMLTPISRRICRLTALRHSPVRLLVVFALGDRLC